MESLMAGRVKLRGPGVEVELRRPSHSGVTEKHCGVGDLFRNGLAAASVALAAFVLAAAPVAMGSPIERDVIVTPDRIGPLQLDVSGPRAVMRFEGFPQAGGPYSLQYDCSRRTGVCRINYFFGRAGKFKGRLVAAVLGTAEFRTRHGTKRGMGESAARGRERKAIPGSLCGNPVLRHPLPSSGSSAPLAGLNMAFFRGKVSGFLILSPHARISCFAGGGFFIG